MVTFISNSEWSLPFCVASNSNPDPNQERWFKTKNCVPQATLLKFSVQWWWFGSWPLVKEIKQVQRRPARQQQQQQEIKNSSHDSCATGILGILDQTLKENKFWRIHGTAIQKKKTTELSGQSSGPDNLFFTIFGARLIMITSEKPVGMVK